MQLVLGWFIYLNRPGVRSPPLPAVGCSLWCGADDNFVLVVRMRHNQLQQLLGGSRVFLTPAGKIEYCNSLLIERWMFVDFCFWFHFGVSIWSLIVSFWLFGSSYRFGFGLRPIVSFWLWASAHRIVLTFDSLLAFGLRCFWAFCFRASLLLGFLPFFFLRFEVTFATSSYRHLVFDIR